MLEMFLYAILGMFASMVVVSVIAFVIMIMEVFK